MEYKLTCIQNIMEQKRKEKHYLTPRYFHRPKRFQRVLPTRKNGIYLEKKYDDLQTSLLSEVLTLKKSCPFKVNFILFGLISQVISRPLVPLGTITSIKISSIVCAQFPHAVFDGTTPLFSSKWSAILDAALQIKLHDQLFSQLWVRCPVFAKAQWKVMRFGARVGDSLAGILKFLPNFLRFGTRKYCRFVEEMSVSILLGLFSFVRAGLVRRITSS